MTGNFQEDFEAWCAGDKSEPFEWDGHIGTGKAKATFHKVPRQSLWQRFWNSPWTWLVPTVFYGWFLTQPGHDWLTWIVFIVSGLNFFQNADERWGKP
jgi:hypothetical protein